MSDSTTAMTAQDVKSHNTKETGLYIIIDKAVYSLSDFADEHPGGEKILYRYGGKDASKVFWKYHNAKVLDKYGPKFKVGDLQDGPPKANL